MRQKTSKSRLVQERLVVVNSRIDELTEELKQLSSEKEKLDITLEVLDSIGINLNTSQATSTLLSSRVKKPVPANLKLKIRPRRITKNGPTEKILRILGQDGIRMTYQQITDELSLEGDVNKASILATLSRMVKDGRLDRLGNMYSINNEEDI